jgi:hypothetical protein
VGKPALGASFVELNAPSKWDPKAKVPIVVKNALRSNLEAVILERDINAALSGYAGSDWNKISVDLRPGIISARGYYHAKSPGLTLLAEVKTGLEIRQGKELWLKDVELKINHDEQTDAVRQAIQGLQPVVDIRNFPFFGDPRGALGGRPETQTLHPHGSETLRGILLRYVRGS